MARYKCLDCEHEFSKPAQSRYTEYPGATPNIDFSSPCCRNHRYEEIDGEDIEDEDDEE